MNNTLLIADLHLTDLPKDDYRWGIFPWLKNQIERYDVTRLIILGDLTDKKDKHSSTLVNKLISNLTTLSRYCEDIIILKGNHDYVDQKSPFFGFLNKMPNITFISQPTSHWIEGTRYHDLFLPHTKNPIEDWGDGFGLLWQHLVDKGEEYLNIFMHQTVSGSIFANGHKFVNDKAQQYNDILSTKDAKVYSGDIHVPQDVGNITYVGSPYSINYGDHWLGRCILSDRDPTAELGVDEFPIKWKVDITSIEELKEQSIEFEEGDKAKVRISLHREDYHLYDELKAETKKLLTELGVESIVEMKSIRSEVDKDVSVRSNDLSMSSKDTLEQFSKREKLSKESIKVGLELLA